MATGFLVDNISGLSLQRYNLEGRGRMFHYRISNWLATQPAVTAGTPINLGALVTVRPGKRFIITNIHMSLSGAGYVEGVVAVDASQNWYQWVGVAGHNNLFGYTRTLDSFGSNGGSIDLKFDAGWTLYENSSISFQYTPPTTTGLNFSVTVSGIEVPNEPNPTASYKIGIVGDSTAWGNNMGLDTQGRLYLGRNQWSEVFRDHARTAGVDAQIFFNDAEDGKTMMEGAYMHLTGFTKNAYDLLFVSFGMNDAVSTKYPTEARFKEAVKVYIDERNRYNKGKPLVFLSPVLTDDVDRTGSSRFDNIKLWLQQVVTDTSLGGGTVNKVYLVDQSQAFGLAADATTDLNYKERVAGTRVHPSGLGSTKIGDYLWEQLKAPIFKK